MIRAACVLDAARAKRYFRATACSPLDRLNLSPNPAEASAPLNQSSGASNAPVHDGCIAAGLVGIAFAMRRCCKAARTAYTGQAIAQLREIRIDSIPCVKLRGGITGTTIQRAVDTRLKIPRET